MIVCGKVDNINALIRPFGLSTPIEFLSTLYNHIFRLIINSLDVYPQLLFGMQS